MQPLLNPFYKVLSALLLALLFSCSKPDLYAQPKPLQVFAAASLAAVMPPITQIYQKKHGREIKLTFGASSTLSRQISHGAPADVFISANPRWMQSLIDAGYASSGSDLDLLHNTLVLVAPASSTIGADSAALSAATLRRWLQEQRLAVGDPQHVPVGIYAEQALRAAELWQSVQPRLAPTEDARASLALLQRGEVALGIVYRSDLKAVANLQVIAELSMPAGSVISYPAAVIGDDPDGDGQRFLEFLRSPDNRHYFLEMGFSPAS